MTSMKEKIDHAEKSNIAAVEIMISTGRITPLAGELLRRTLPHFFRVIAEETESEKYTGAEVHLAVLGTLINILNGYAATIGQQSGMPQNAVLIGIIQQMLDMAIHAPRSPLVSPNELSH